MTTTNEETSDDIVEFPIHGPHVIGPLGVFRGSAFPRILGLVAVGPFLSFPIQLALFFTVGWPLEMLQATILSILPVPIFAWMIAASYQTSFVFVWRSYFGVPTLRREPWARDDVFDLPAVAWQRVGESQKLVPVIDALHDEVTDPDRDPGKVTGADFNPYSPPPKSTDDELVSLMLRTEAASGIYSVRQLKDRYHNLKVGGMLVILGVIPFITWLVLSSMTKPPVQ